MLYSERERKILLNIIEYIQYHLGKWYTNVLPLEDVFSLENLLYYTQLLINYSLVIKQKCHLLYSKTFLSKHLLEMFYAYSS